MRLFLKWFFALDFKIAGTDTAPKLNWRIGSRDFWFKSPFRTYWPEGPSLEDYRWHKLLHHNLVFFQCKACKSGVWGYGQTDICGQWKCYKKVYGVKA